MDRDTHEHEHDADKHAAHAAAAPAKGQDPDGDGVTSRTPGGKDALGKKENLLAPWFDEMVDVATELAHRALPALQVQRHRVGERAVAIEDEGAR